MAYAFLYTAAYMFGDRVAPAHLKASVQSLLAFLLLGIGQVLSGFLFGYQIDRSAPAITKTVVTQEGQVAKGLPAWNVPEMETSAWRYLDLAKSVKYIGGNETVFNFGEHLGKYTREDGSIDLDRLPAVWESAGVSYAKDELKATFDKIGNPVTRDKYLQAQRHNWTRFFVRRRSSSVSGSFCSSSWAVNPSRLRTNLPRHSESAPQANGAFRRIVRVVLVALVIDSRRLDRERRWPWAARAIHLCRQAGVCGFACGCSGTALTVCGSKRSRVTDVASSSIG